MQNPSATDPRKSILTTMISIALFALLVVPTSQNTQKVDLEAVRKDLNETYKIWGKARVDLDNKLMDKMLATDFYVLLAPDRKMTKKEFIDGNSKPLDTIKLVRFESDIMTIMIKKDITEAVITEKLEYDVKTPEGTTARVYNFWVTRDGWKKTDSGWVAQYSEAVGAQGWRGTKPPIPNWG